MRKPIETMDDVLALLRLARREADAGAGIGPVRELLARAMGG